MIMGMMIYSTVQMVFFIQAIHTIKELTIWIASTCIYFTVDLLVFQTLALKGLSLCKATTVFNLFKAKNLDFFL